MELGALLLVFLVVVSGRDGEDLGNITGLPVCGDCVRCHGAIERNISSKSYRGREASYVVVGAGTSGSILASRLAEAGHEVILLEAGGTTQSEFIREAPITENQTSVFDVPLEWLEICRNPAFEHYQWEVDGSPKVSIAKGIGGCSIHNAMLYMRGVSEDFEEWPEGWQFQDVLPYYTKSENNSNFPVSQFHGKDGPIQISSPHKKFHDSITPRFIEAFQELGYGVVEDFNGEPTNQKPSETGKSGRTGAGYLQFAIREGVRDSSAAAYFGKSHPASVIKPSINFHGHCGNKKKSKKSKNSVKRGDYGSLHIMAHAQATRIIFENKKGDIIARGVNLVRLDSDDKPKCRCTVFARKEVILSAGAINSPKLLLLSGVGPAKQLEKLGIPVVIDVKGVGENFMDGAYAIVQFEAPDLRFQRCEKFEKGAAEGGLLGQSPPTTQRCQKEWQLYLKGGQGLFGTPGFFAGGFMQSPGHSRPNIQLTLHPYDKVNQQPWAFKYGRRSSESIDACRDGPVKCNLTNAHNSERGRIVTVEVAHNLPASRGRVSLQNAHPLTPATLNGSYLSVRSDVEALLWALREVRTIFNTFALKKVIGKELLPGKHINAQALENYIKCATIDTTSDVCENQNAPVVGHLAGTCKMGDLEDSMAVVSPTLRVRGTKGQG
ncbi:hypothetical protein AAMO2058_000123100 [Amorphochlora amoebiformis]